MGIEEKNENDIVGIQGLSNPPSIPFWGNSTAKVRVWVIVLIISVFFGFIGGKFAIDNHLFPYDYESGNFLNTAFAVIYFLATAGILLSKKKILILFLYFIFSILVIIGVSEIVAKIGSINIS